MRKNKKMYKNISHKLFYSNFPKKAKKYAESIYVLHYKLHVAFIFIFCSRLEEGKNSPHNNKNNSIVNSNRCTRNNRHSSKRERENEKISKKISTSKLVSKFKCLLF